MSILDKQKEKDEAWVKEKGMVGEKNRRAKAFKRLWVTQLMGSFIPCFCCSFTLSLHTLSLPTSWMEEGGVEKSKYPCLYHYSSVPLGLISICCTAACCRSISEDPVSGEGRMRRKQQDWKKTEVLRGRNEVCISVSVYKWVINWMTYRKTGTSVVSFNVIQKISLQEVVKTAQSSSKTLILFTRNNLEFRAFSGAKICMSAFIGVKMHI